MIAAVCSACVPEPGLQIDVRLGNAKLVEELSGQRAVVVLSGMDETVP
jgi:hypothetical protein